MMMIDDATNWTHAKFFESETTAAAMTVFQEHVGYYGLPRSLYVDRDSFYETTRFTKRRGILRWMKRYETQHR